MPTWTWSTVPDNAAFSPPVRWACRVGIVGAGRSRNGLGPFLARAFANAGATVVGTSGRDPAAAVLAAAALQQDLGHPVDGYPDARSLAGAVDLLVVASPAEVHLDGLRAALSAGVPCLCEKPLVPVFDTAAGAALVEAFVARDLPLAENCQWPCVLPAVAALHPDLVGQPIRTVAMGLGPTGVGRAMLADSLSHLLSVVQAVVPPGSTLQVLAAGQSAPAADATANVVTAALATAAGPIQATLHLQHCPEQPRPAWLALNGHRIDRTIGPGYTIGFSAGERSLPTPDPLQQLVYRLAALLPHRALERTRSLAAAVAVRLRCAAELFAALDG